MGVFEDLAFEVLKTAASALTKAGLEKTGGVLAQWLDVDAKKRVNALGKAWQKAVDKLPEGEVRKLVEHAPFQKEVVIGLLDRIKGFDLEKAAADWSEKLPDHADDLHDFFSNLRFAIAGDDLLAPVFARYKDARRSKIPGLPATERELVQRVMVEKQIIITAADGGIAVGKVDGDIVNHDKLVVHGDYLLNIYHVYQLPSGKVALSEEQFQQVLKEYLRWVFNAYSQARLYGLESLRTASGQPVRQLKDVFIPLTLMRISPPSRQELQEVDNRGENLFARSVAYQHLIENKQQKSEKVKLRQLLTIHPQLAIIGGAGSGKSTLLAYLAATLAQAGREGTPPALTLPKGKPVLLPVLVPLRYYREYLSYCKSDPAHCAQEPSAGTLAGFIPWYFRRRNPALDVTEDFFDRLLKGGGCLLMLDGLDEVVNQEERGRVRQQVDELITDIYPSNHIIVTARESGYRENAIFGDNFVRLDVSQLDDDQIAVLVENWCKQLYPPVEVKTRKTELVDAIANINTRYVQRSQPPLISSPLMTTMVVSVKWGDTELPRERARLYEAAVRVILQTQYIPEDSARKELVDWGGTWEEQRDWLSQLALEMQRGGQAGAAISQSQVEATLTKAGVAEDAIQRFIRAVRHRGGLFEERGEIFQFVHLTFQEFLAARWQAKQRKEALSGLEKYLRDSWWREVYLLLYGFALADYAPFAKQYLQWLSNRDGDDEMRLKGLELAGTVLMEMDKPELAIMQEQAKLIVQFGFNPQKICQAPAILRAEAGNTLAQLGDPRREVMDVDAMRFCFVPGGDFWYEGDKKPKKLTQDAFWMAESPVSNAQFEAFVKEDGYLNPEWWLEAELKEKGWWSKDGFKNGDEGVVRTKPYEFRGPFGLSNHPVVGVSWYEARAFTRWLTRRWQLNGSEVMLPSEQQWEKAARGGVQIPTLEEVKALGLEQVKTQWNPTLKTFANPEPKRTYPWEGKFDTNRASIFNTHIGATSTLGCFPQGASPYGIQELSGNVWEWQDSWYEKEIKCVRGCCWSSAVGYARCSSRFGYYPNSGSDFIGFRCVLSPGS